MRQPHSSVLPISPPDEAHDPPPGRRRERPNLSSGSEDVVRLAGVTKRYGGRSAATTALDDITLMTRVSFVMKEGVVYKRP